MSKLLRSPLGVIIILLSFTMASFWSLVLWKSAQERGYAFAKAGSETQGLTHSLAQHASKSFGAVALALIGARQYIQHSDRSARASAEINDLLAQYVRSIPHVRELGVLSESGSWMYSSFETVPPVNNADREYFQYHRTHDDPAARIGEPLLSRVTGRPTLLMTQRLSNPDGSFGGVVFGAIDLEDFRSFYRSFEADQHRTVTLMKTNGKVLVHRDPNEVGKDLAGSGLFSQRLKDSDTGLYPIVSPFDGQTKQFAYEKLPDFPFVVSVAVPEDDILAGWRRERRFDLLLSGEVSAVLLAIALVLAGQFRKRSQMARTLRERERRYRLLAENVEDVVTQLGAKGKRLYISPSVEKLLGWTASEMLAHSAYSDVHPAHRDIVVNLIESLGPDERDFRIPQAPEGWDLHLGRGQVQFPQRSGRGPFRDRWHHTGHHPAKGGRGAAGCGERAAQGALRDGYPDRRRQPAAVRPRIRRRVQAMPAIRIAAVRSLHRHRQVQVLQRHLRAWRGR